MKKKNDFGRFDFVGTVGIFGGISALFVVLSLVYLGVKGISYGIDFRGGTEIQVQYGESVSIDQVRGALSDLDVGDLGVQSIGDQHEFLIRFQGRKGATDKETNDLLNKAITDVQGALEKALPNAKGEFRRVDTVGPQVGADLKRSGFLAVFYSLLVILIYIGFRFDYKYSPGAVICLIHDAIITVAVFELTGREFNVPILAAVLTLIGFSLNDTIVVFDRIRENEGDVREKGWGFVINKAINDTLERTIITSGTTFISSAALAVFADGTVADIAFAISVGVAFGTYSSIYVAAPMILLMEKLKPSTRPA